MTLPTKSFSDFVSGMVATWAAQTGTTPVFSDGDILLAWWQAVAVQLDFLQAQVQLVVALSRAQTSTGDDLDSWMAQFNFTRLGSTFATGPVTLSKATASAVQIQIPVGSVIQTVGGAVQYEVVADTDELAFNTTLNAYVLPAGQLSVTATVQAIVGGSASNVSGNTLTQFGSNVAGIDSVTNPAPITNGIDAESDQNFRIRFVLYLATLAKATKNALLAAAMSVQQGLAVTLLENQQPDGTPLLGSFTGVVDDGSGEPPTSTLNAVFAAFDATRAFSVQPFVVQPIPLAAVVTLSVRLATGVVAATTNTAVQTAVVLAVNALAPSATLYVSEVVAAALSVTGVVSVNSGITINGLSQDLVPTIQQEIRTTLFSVTVTNY